MTQIKALEENTEYKLMLVSFGMGSYKTWIGATPSMQTLPDYLGVFRIQTKSPTLPYGSPNLPDIRKKVHNIHFLDIFWPIFGILEKKLDI